MRARRAVLTAGILWVSGFLIVVAMAAAGAPHPGAAPAARTPASSLAPSGTTPLSPPSATARALTTTALLSNLRAHHVPGSVIHPPNLNVRPTDFSGVVAPPYTGSPAPMGIADLGLRTNGVGHTVGYVLNTPSVEGVTTVNAASVFYLDGLAPFNFSIQLNSVLNNVTLFNRSANEFWSQNVVEYSTQTNQLTFYDSVWNFSSAAGIMTANALYAHGPNGTTVPGAGGLYYARGPTWTVPEPFTLALYLNATTVGDRPATYFNYSLSSTTVRAAGSFDFVVYNSTGFATPTARALPYFQINGQHLLPIGLISDAELVLGGGMDGATTSVLNFSGTMQLFFENSTTLADQVVPSAYNAGADTAETSEGLGEWYSPAPSPLVHLGAGPSFVGGLWNESGVPGDIQVNMNLHPANAFLFVSPGNVYSDFTAAWAPMPATGNASYALPPGNYSFEALLSRYLPNATIGPVNGSTNLSVTLAPNANRGVYTPLWAWSNSELAALSFPGGAGTSRSPYVLFNTQNGSINRVFSSLNDYFYPVFPGIELANTNAYVDLNDTPSYLITYISTLGPTLAAFGLPNTNYLQFQFYNVSHASLYNSSVISGWFSAEAGAFAPEESVANVMFWDSSNDLVANNTFYDSASSLLIYGGGTNTVFGNTFLPSTTVAPSQRHLLSSVVAPTGVTLYSSGDLVYNNYFSVPNPASTPSLDLVTHQTVLQSDLWNVSRRPASSVFVVNGYALTGNIVGLSYEGGNFWSNYGTSSNPYGVLPYNNTGAISLGGDYLPLVPANLYTVTFTETGLAPGTAWFVSFNGFLQSTTGTSILFEQSNGTYVFTVGGGVAGLHASPGSGIATVAGAPQTEAIAFVSLSSFAVLFQEVGLPPGTLWNVTVGPSTELSTGTQLAFVEFNGSYDFSVTATGGYAPSPATGRITVAGSPLTETIHFAVQPGSLTGTLTPDTANLTIAGAPVTLGAGGSFLFQAAPGVYAVEASAPGYYSYFNNASLVAGVNTTLTITLVSQAGGGPGAPGNLSITVTPTNAQVMVDGTVLTGSGGSFAMTGLAPGLHAIEAQAAGYATYFNNVSISSGTTRSVAIHLTNLSTVSSTSAAATPFLSSPLFYGLLVAGILVAIGLVVLGLLLRRPRSPVPAREFHPKWAEPPANEPPP